MSSQPQPVPHPSDPADTADDALAGAQQLTDVITRLRRALRSSIRSEFPWEALPMAQVELLQTLAPAPCGSANWPPASASPPTPSAA